MKPKLYQYSVCPFCSKVSSLLSYKGIEFEKVEVHPFKKKEIAFSTDYQAVPIYIDSRGNQVNDSTPIMRHIDKEFPNPPVFRTHPAEKEKEEEWLAWSEKLVQALPTIVYDSFPHALEAFDYITKTGKFSWWESRSVKYSGAFVMSLVAKKIRKRLSIEDPAKYLEEKVREWGLALQASEFMGGDTPNAADIAVFGICRVISSLPPGKILSANPIFWQWYNNMSESIGKRLIER